MAIAVTLNGTTYSVPEPGDVGYDQQLTNYLVALGTAFPQLGTSSPQALTAEWAAGTSFGIRAPYIKTAVSPFASAGVVRLARTDSIDWRNQANNADLALAVDSANNLSFNSNYVTGNPLCAANTIAGQSIANATVSIVVFGSIEIDTDTAFNSGTGRYTVPTNKGGHYNVLGQIAFASALTTTVIVAIYKNAVEVKRTQIVNPGAGEAVALIADLNLAAADVIDIRVTQSAGTSQALATTANLNFFGLKRITT